jgi:hypothetical protein
MKKLTLAAGMAALVLTAPAMAQQTGEPRWYPTRVGLTHQQFEIDRRHCMLVSINNLWANGMTNANPVAAITSMILCMEDRGWAYRSN